MEPNCCAATEGTGRQRVSASKLAHPDGSWWHRAVGAEGEASVGLACTLRSEVNLNRFERALAQIMTLPARGFDLWTGAQTAIISV